MEVETSAVEQSTNEDICVNVETPKEVEIVEETGETSEGLNDSLNNGVINQPVAAVVYEPLVPDVTKFAYDVQHGYRVFCELLSDQYKSVTKPFREPVDVEGLGLWDYYTRIENPMSFRQIDIKFKSYLYQNITEVVADLRLILENCYRYNGSDHWISKLAQKLEKVLDQKLALLNRSLRDKVSLQATMAFRNNKTVVTADSEELGGRRRRSGRTNYSSIPSGDQTSRLVNHLILEKEETQKELRRQKEKERKEANEALMHELAEWESEVFTSDVIKELFSMWEVPSIGSFLWLFQEALNLPELNYTEFENGLIIPNKSCLIAWIFTALLVTPSQRKSIQKKLPMKFSVWQKKLKDRIDMWYITREAEEFELVTHQTGPDNEFFEILGDSNPLEKTSYHNLSLHQRVLILKALCDECVDYEPQLRDYIGNADTTPFREIILGNDAANYSYVYFPIFDATDVRIYKQAALPSAAEWYKKWKSNNTSGGYVKRARVNQPKSRKSDSRKSGWKSRAVSSTIKEGFELVCHDIETLQELCEKFADDTTKSSGRKRRGRPPRKLAETQLHERLVGLLEELSVSEGRYSKARIKGMLNLMKEWRSEEEPDDSGVNSTELSENQIQDDDVRADESYSIPLEVQQHAHHVSERHPLSQEKPNGNMLTNTMELDTSKDMTSHDEDNFLLSMVTRSKRVYSDRVYVYTPPPSKRPDSTVDKIIGDTTVFENPENTNTVFVKDDQKGMITDELIPKCSENKEDDILTNIDISGNIESKNMNVVTVETSWKGDDSENVKPASSRSGEMLDHVSSDSVAMETNDQVQDVVPAPTNPVLSPRTPYNSEKDVKVKPTVPVSVPAVTDHGLGHSFGSCDTKGSFVEKNTVTTEGDKTVDSSEKNMNTTDICGNKDGYVGIKRGIDGNTDGVHVDHVVVTQGTKGDKPENIMDSKGTEVVQETVVHQNGACKQMSVCNGEYEPSTKRHCSETENQTGSLVTNHQASSTNRLSETVHNDGNAVTGHSKTMDSVSLETSQQSPLAKILKENVPHLTSSKLPNSISLETYSQSSVKTS